MSYKADILKVNNMLVELPSRDSRYQEHLDGIVRFVSFGCFR